MGAAAPCIGNLARRLKLLRSANNGENILDEPVLIKTIKKREVNMGDKGKKDKGKREGQKKSMQTAKEKRKQKKEKTPSGWQSGR